MQDIELVVKIDEKLYKDIFSDAEIMIYSGMRSGKTLLATLLRAIRKSKPLPKGHGDLIDKSLLYPDSDYDDGLFYAVSIGQINGTATIIKADTESEDKE